MSRSALGQGLAHVAVAVTVSASVTAGVLLASATHGADKNVS